MRKKFHITDGSGGCKSFCGAQHHKRYLGISWFVSTNRDHWAENGLFTGVYLMEDPYYKQNVCKKCAARVDMFRLATCDL